MGAAMAVIAVIAFASAAYGNFWFELPAVIVIPFVWWAIVHMPERSHGLTAIPFARHPGRHQVTLSAPGADRTGVIYVVVCSLNVGLGEAQRLLSRMPAVLVTGVSAEAAHAFAARLEAAGAGVTVGTDWETA
jgi:ribosomal protein L7/L12